MVTYGVRRGKLILKLLGPPEVLHDGRAVRLRARKALALLAYLAAEGGVRSRREITDLLWPRSDERRGKAALRTVLSSLRKTLEEADEPSGGHHLLADGDSLGLAFGPDLKLDLHILEAAHTLARSNPHSKELEDGVRCDVLARLQAGVEAYRGDFLEGFSLDDTPDFDLWVEAEREAWRGRVDLVYEHLSRYQLEDGEIKDAIVTASRWTEHAPVSEEAHRRLMEAQFASGDRSGALNTYETFRSVLARRLGVEPGPKTEALVAHTRGVGTPEHVLSSASRPLAPSTPRPETPRAFPNTPFVGRAKEFGALVEGYQAVSSGKARVVALLGDAGIGKTRLAEEFLLWAREEGADAFSGQTYEVGGRLPYEVLIDALRPRLERERAPEDLLEDVWLSELSRILPELRERYPDLTPPTNEGVETRANLFEAVTRLVLALAERSPVVLFLDDLHWASTASLDMLQYAGRRWAEEGARVLLVLGLRVGATEALPSPAGWISELDHALPVRYLMLDPLAADDTLNLLRALSSEPMDDSSGGRLSPELERFGRWLFEETSGHPLFLAETVKALVEQGVLALRLGADGASWIVSLTSGTHDVGVLRGLLPESVREAIGTQLSRLSSAASNVLAAAAVLGTGFTFEHLVGVAGMKEDECLSALDEALASRLLRQADDDSYAFSHDKIRDVAYTEAGSAKRRVFHRRALRVLEEEGAPPAWLSRHALAAGMTETAFGYLLDAGDAAMAVFASDDAIGYYEQARGLLSGEPGRGRGLQPVSSPSVELEHLHVNLGRAYELAGRWQEAQGIYEKMLSQAQEARDPRLQWAALNRLAILAGRWHFDMGRAEALIQESLAVATSSDDQAMLAETEWNVAQMAAMKWEPQIALSHGQRALDLAGKTGLKELEARSLFVLAQAYRFSGRWDECVTYALRAAALYETLSEKPQDTGTLAAQFVWAGAPPSKMLANQAMKSLSLSLLALGEINRGSPKAAVEASRWGLRIGQEIDNDWAQTNALVLLGYGLWEMGEYDETLRVVQQGLKMARKVHHLAAIFILTVLGNTPRAMFGLEEDARTVLLEALALADAKLPRPWKTTAISKLCANRALVGEWEAAYCWAVEALEIRNAAPTRLITFDFERHHETEALLRNGDRERAREDARRLGESVDGNQRFSLVHSRMLAVLEKWDGHSEGAIGHLRDAEKLAEEMRLSGTLWQIKGALGELYEECDETEKAREAFDGARTIVRELAEKMKDSELRSTFLSAPQVRRVLER